MSKATFCVLLVLMVLCSTACAARVRNGYTGRVRMARMEQYPVKSAECESITPYVCCNAL